MDKKITGIVAYITIIGWIIAYVAGDKENAKFHLNQAFVVDLFAIIGGVVAGVLTIIPVVGWICGIVISLVVLAVWILGIVYAVQGVDKEIPVLGSIKIFS